MGSIGDCYDNAVIESFWSRMQVELLDRQRWRTRLELANAMFDFLEMFHNRRRRHCALGWLTPIEFEKPHINHRGMKSSEATPRNLGAHQGVRLRGVTSVHKVGVHPQMRDSPPVGLLLAATHPLHTQEPAVQRSAG